MNAVELGKSNIIVRSRLNKNDRLYINKAIQKRNKIEA